MSSWSVLGKYEQGQDVIKLVLENRGFNTKTAQEEFLTPPPVSHFIKHLPPEVKSSLKNAKKIITDAMESELPIIIHGDYDADGVCATAILFNTLKFELKYEKTFAFIPNRFEHGYGLSHKSIDGVLDKVTKSLQGLLPEKVLFITVDSGITAVEEIEYIKNLGHLVIVTDHHQKPKKLPSADELVWYDQIVGSTISWLVSRVLGSTDDQSLGLAALATVTDIQPLLGFNRTIVKEGLRILNTDPPLGIKKLAQSAGIKVGDKNTSDYVGGESGSKEIGTYELGWVLGPRLNASGRLVDASDSLLLLVDKNEQILDVLAARLAEANNERQDKTSEMFDLAKDFQGEDSSNLPKIIIAHDADFHEGIIGLVAAKLTQKYYRPAIVISTGELHGKGSVRSIPGVDIISILREFDDLFVDLGGHPMAAGFTIEIGRLEELKNVLAEYFTHNVNDELYEKTLEVDLELPIKLVNLELLTDLEKLEPFGVGNSQPVFLSTAVTISGVNWVGKENHHLSLRLTDGQNFWKAIFFNAQENETAIKLTVGTKIDIVYKLKKNEYQGKITVDLQVVDLALTA